jgi:DNA-binding response OmpR family regulator
MVDNVQITLPVLPFAKVIDKFPLKVADSLPTLHLPQDLHQVLPNSGVDHPVKPKVLIVDDEDFFRKMIVLGFERNGFTVFQADNGEDAVKIAHAELPDVILLDLLLPKLLGFEVCRMLRKDDRFSKTAIIIMSAKSYKPDMDKAAELGADAYVVKPFEFSDLLKTASDNMNRRKNSQ